MSRGGAPGGGALTWQVGLASPAPRVAGALADRAWDAPAAVLHVFGEGFLRGADVCSNGGRSDVVSSALARCERPAAAEDGGGIWGAVRPVAAADFAGATFGPRRGGDGGGDLVAVGGVPEPSAASCRHSCWFGTIGPVELAHHPGGAGAPACAAPAHAPAQVPFALGCRDLPPLYDLWGARGASELFEFFAPPAVVGSLPEAGPAGGGGALELRFLPAGLPIRRPPSSEEPGLACAVGPHLAPAAWEAAPAGAGWVLSCGLSGLVPEPGFVPLGLLLDGGGGAAVFSAGSPELQFQFRERPAVDAVFPHAMPAPGGHVVSAAGSNLHSAGALAMLPLGSKGVALPSTAAAGVSVSSALWRGEAPAVSPGAGSGDLAVGAVVAGAAVGSDGAFGELGTPLTLSWVSAKTFPDVGAATVDFPLAGPRGEPELPEEGGAAVVLRAAGLAGPALAGAGCRFGSVGVAGRASGGASAGLECTSPALAPTQVGRQVPVALEWEFQGALSQAGSGALPQTPVTGPSGPAPAALSAASFHSIFGTGPGTGHPPHAPPGGRGAAYVALRGGSALCGWGPDSGGWAAPGVLSAVSAGEVTGAVQPAAVWAGAAALVRVSGLGFREGASACEVGGRRLPSRFISSALLTCEWLPGLGQIAGGDSPGRAWELHVNSPLALAGEAAREDGAGRTAGGASLSTWGDGGSGGLPLLPELWPTQGPARGGTPVTLRWAGGAGAGGPAEPACLFGAVRVGSVRKDAGGFECVAPARASGAAEVAVALGAQHSTVCAVQFRYRRPSAPPYHRGAPASSIVNAF